MRRLNLFEMVLFILGIFFIGISYFAIHRLLMLTGFSWSALIAIFLWIMIVILIITVAVLENMKEEIRAIIGIGTEETKLLREETRLLRKEMRYKK